MAEVELTKIIIDETRQDQIFVLKEKKGLRQFPIVIGFLEASSIKMKLSNIEPPRPMTHDLLVNAIDVLGAKMENLFIDKMENGTFHAKIKLKLKNGEVKVVDSRPSDGIAVAVRTGAPIFVDEEVIIKASVTKTEQ